MATAGAIAGAIAVANDFEPIQLQRFKRTPRELSRRLEIQRGVATLNRAADPDDEQQALRRLHDRLRASKVPPSIPDAPHVGATAPVEGSK